MMCLPFQAWMWPEKQWIHYCRLLPTYASVCFRNKPQTLLRFRFTVQDLQCVIHKQSHATNQPTTQPANQPTCKQTSPCKSKLGVQPNGSPLECPTNISDIYYPFVWNRPCFKPVLCSRIGTTTKWLWELSEPSQPVTHAYEPVKTIYQTDVVICFTQSESIDIIYYVGVVSFSCKADQYWPDVLANETPWRSN